MLTTAQAAARLGIQRSQVNKLILRGVIKAEAIGEGRRKIWNVDAQSVEEYRKERKPKGRPSK